MQAVKEILQAHGYESVADMEVGESVEVELDSEAMMPLVIEKTADDHADEENHPTFKAYNQRPEKAKQPAGFVGGSTAR